MPCCGDLHDSTISKVDKEEKGRGTYYYCYYTSYEPQSTRCIAQNENHNLEVFPCHSPSDDRTSKMTLSMSVMWVDHLPEMDWNQGVVTAWDSSLSIMQDIQSMMSNTKVSVW
jgi:hypothetical protein